MYWDIIVTIGIVLFVATGIWVIKKPEQDETELHARNRYNMTDKLEEDLDTLQRRKITDMGVTRREENNDPIHADEKPQEKKEGA